MIGSGVLKQGWVRMGVRTKRKLMMENNPSNIVDFWSPGCGSQKGLRAAIMLLSMEMPTSLRVIISALAGTRGSAEIVVGQGAWLQWRWALGCDGTRGWNRMGNWT